jgi:CDP-glycerol glycerophosphotransferase (TagB/SpsB family)
MAGQAESMNMSALGKAKGFMARFLGVNPGAEVNREVVALRSLGLFDEAGYLRRYPDVAAQGTDPVLHYVLNGASESRNPCDLFDTAYYLEKNPDVASTGANPLLHYCLFGFKEGRSPSVEFDAPWYIRTYLDEGTETNPLRHYLEIGRAAGLEIRRVPDLVRDTLLVSGTFDRDYYLLQYPDVLDSGLEPIDHYLAYGAKERRNPNAIFDARYYIAKNPEVSSSRINPLYHFCEYGWKQLCNPSADFDVWWYWTTHLDPASEEINPLAHYLAIGSQLELDTRPPRPPSQFARDGYRHADGVPIKRICLFAGYDPDGLIDDYVVDYLRELSQYADIYYLADCEMPQEQLAKIEGYTNGAWSERHGNYDFGSYSRLANQLVGWEKIEQYDELILANDSCYLLRDMHHVFAKMDAKACDWWGMQATKGMAATRREPKNRFPRPIPMEAVRRSMLQGFEDDYRYDFHVGSYFVVYRRPVIADGRFRRLLDTVTAQESKRNVILKYEAGFTRYLVSAGYVLDTFIDSLYPFHPIYTSWYFRLLEEGFPFLKRYLLTENHYHVPRLGAWMENGLKSFPQANISTIRHNLQRVADPDKLQQNLQIGTSLLHDDGQVPAVLLSDQEFIAADEATPKYNHWWVFPVCAFTGVFSGNERALFEEVKNDPSIKKIVLIRDGPVSVDGVDVEVASLQSPQGQYYLLRAGNLFIKHSTARNLVYPVASELHNLINLWHGIPFKRIGYASLDTQQNRIAVARDHAKYRAVISSSQVDTLAMVAAFHPLSYTDIWNTGLPRNDFILRSFEQLPEDLRREGAALYDLMAGRKLVLFLPTFRNAQADAYFRFNEAQIDWIGGWMRENNAVLGIREHMADSARTYGAQFASIGALDLSDATFPNVEILYRYSSALITDYSSCFIDYMLTDKPAISFAYDYDSYASVERGSFYDLDFVFPGPVCKNFTELQAALEGVFSEPTPVARASREWKRKLFFDYVDDRSSARVMARVKHLADSSDLGRDLLGRERS